MELFPSLSQLNLQSWLPYPMLIVTEDKYEFTQLVHMLLEAPTILRNTNRLLTSSGTLIKSRFQVTGCILPSSIQLDAAARACNPSSLIRRIKV
jgi:hypothetical protein